MATKLCKGFNAQRKIWIKEPSAERILSSNLRRLPNISKVVGNNNEIPKRKFNIRNDRGFYLFESMKTVFHISRSTATAASTEWTAEI